MLDILFATKFFGFNEKLSDNSINFRCMNLPNGTTAVRIASNYVEYQHQQLSITDVCVEMD